MQVYLINMESQTVVARHRVAQMRARWQAPGRSSISRRQRSNGKAGKSQGLVIEQMQLAVRRQPVYNPALRYIR